MKKLMTGFVLGITSIMLAGFLFTSVDISAEESPIYMDEDVTEVEAFAETYGVDLFVAAAIVRLTNQEDSPWTVEELLAMDENALFELVIESIPARGSWFTRSALDADLKALVLEYIEVYDLDPGQAFKTALLVETGAYTAADLIGLTSDELQAIYHDAKDAGLVEHPGQGGPLEGVRHFMQGRFENRGIGRGTQYDGECPNDSVPEDSDPDGLSF